MSEATTPLFKVTKGEPTPEELAALTAVVSSLAAAPAPDGQQARHSARFWSRRSQFNVPLKPGQGAWRRAGR